MMSLLRKNLRTTKPVSKNMNDSRILILDFGSQYTQLIARRIRELHVYCEIHPYHLSLEKIKAFSPKGIILSGGPASVLSQSAYVIDPAVFQCGVPILGICYGMQLMAHMLSGKVHKADKREYGKAEIHCLDTSDLFYGFDSHQPVSVWMSHGDSIEKMPKGFLSLAKTSNSPIDDFKNYSCTLFGLQFHPEVVHTQRGIEILSNFIFRICQTKPSWTMKSFIESSIEDIRRQVGDQHVILGLSGGVDSSVTAFLLHRAIGYQLTLIFMNNGLLRLDEEKEVIALFQKERQMNIRYVNASERFLSALEDVTDPEVKRKTIGRVFVDVFEEEAAKIPGAAFLAQGTLYPDVIESVSFKGPSATIKTHHNVGGIPKKMKLKLIEPLRELFKDEVRLLGKELGVAESFLSRHPFPGPGLAVRILGEVTPERLSLLRKADHIVVSEIKSAGLYEKIWQAFAVLLPIKTVGVMGDERTYEHVVVIRAVKSEDGMTADWADIPYEVLGKISNRIINEVRGINRVAYDISSKPPSTIEWE